MRGRVGARGLGLVSGVGPRGAKGREERMSGWAARPRGKELGRQVWAAWVGLLRFGPDGSVSTGWAREEGLGLPFLFLVFSLLFFSKHSQNYLNSN